MGYMHIDNLYKIPQEILALGEVFALEKIHGTSAHIAFKDGKPTFFSGGEKHENFIKLFDAEELAKKYADISGTEDATIYGEAYGGKCQGMSGTYGKSLRFIAFDVLIGGKWWDVPSAAHICSQLGLEFVAYNRGPSTVEWLDSQRDLPSRQAVFNGVLEPKVAEGIVIRPILERDNRFGHRLIAKHKRAEFGETKTPRAVDLVQAQVLADAQAVADEWVTSMRVEHVLDKLPEATELKATKRVMDAVVEDVKREGDGEIKWSHEVEKAIATAAAKFYKKKLTAVVDKA